MHATGATMFVPDNYTMKVIFHFVVFVFDFYTCSSVVKKKEVVNGGQLWMKVRMRSQSWHPSMIFEDVEDSLKVVF